MATFSTAVRQFYNQYATFGGRSSRSQYWWPQVYMLVVCWILEGLAVACGAHGFGHWLFSALLWLFGVVNIIPGLAVGVRRLHDTGRGGGWIFINLVPFIGNIWYLILMILPSEGANRFGNPE